MRILIAEDEAMSRRVLESTLSRWGFEVVSCVDGDEALIEFEKLNPPLLAILDVLMPGATGIEICKSVRQKAGVVPPYLILLTARSDKPDVVRGLEAGANDYITKPFDPAELRARINVGAQMVSLRQKLAQRVSELELALSQVKTLEGMLPICSYCKSIRDDRNYWQGVEEYLRDHSSAEFSHGICPTCYERVVIPQLEDMRERLKSHD